MQKLRDWLIHLGVMGGIMLDGARRAVRAYPKHLRLLKMLIMRSLGKLRWRQLRGNPVVLLMALAALAATINALLNWQHGSACRLDIGISLWLWLAIWPSLLLESVVEERGQTELARLQPSRHKLYVQRVRAAQEGGTKALEMAEGAVEAAGAASGAQSAKISETEIIALERLVPGDVIVVGEGMLIPVEGRVIGGMARLDESMLSGETELVVRDAIENSAVTAGAQVVSGRLQIMVTKVASEYLVEGGDGADERLAALPAANSFARLSTLVATGSMGGVGGASKGSGNVSGAGSTRSGRGDFLENMLAIYAVSTLLAVVALAMILARVGTPLSLNVLIALWSCLVPTTVSALLPSIRMIGMLKLLRKRVVTLSGRALETAGELEEIYFDKTGTVTCGYLAATAFYPLAAGSLEQLMRLVVLAMQKDRSAEARSAVLAAGQWLRHHYHNGCDNCNDRAGRQDKASGNDGVICETGAAYGGATGSGNRNELSLKLQAALAIPSNARYLAMDEQTRLGGVDLLGWRGNGGVTAGDSGCNESGCGGSDDINGHNKDCNKDCNKACNDNGCYEDGHDGTYGERGTDSKDGCYRLRWGALNLIRDFCRAGYEAAMADGALQAVLKELTEAGDGAIAIADQERLYGIIRLHDGLKKGVEDLSNRLAKLGIESVIVSGDNALTTAQTAKMMRVSKQLAAACPEVKARKILERQEQGHVVAMVGDGLNDVPALQQADLAIVMNSGNVQARRWADMVDLDSDPRSLLDIVRIGRRIMLMRGALTAFSLVNDAIKCLIVLPIILMQSYPALAAFNFLHLHTLASAILAALTFNALIVPCSLLLAFWRAQRTHASIAHLLRQNVQYFGTIGVLLPAIGIKLLEYLYL